MKAIYKGNDGIFLSFEGGNMVRFFRTFNRKLDGRRVFEATLTLEDMANMHVFAQGHLDKSSAVAASKKEDIVAGTDTLIELFYEAYSKINMEKLNEINKAFPCVSIDEFETMTLEQARSALAEVAAMNVKIASEERISKSKRNVVKLVPKSEPKGDSKKSASSKSKGKTGADT